MNVKKPIKPISNEVYLRGDFRFEEVTVMLVFQGKRLGDFNSPAWKKKAMEREKLGGVVEQAREKWEGVLKQLEAVAGVLYASCSFCDYYEHCENCPLGTPEKGAGRGCDDYEDISSKLNSQKAAALRVLEVINAVDVDPCMHLTEMEVTTAEDEARFFKCVSCGRHRMEEFL
jgi:hypothetical protein